MDNENVEDIDVEIDVELSEEDKNAINDIEEASISDAKKKKHYKIMQKYWDSVASNNKDLKKEALDEMCQLVSAYVHLKINQLTPAALKTKEQIEDLTNECFQMIIETIDNYDGIRSPLTYWETRLVGTIKSYNLKDKGLKINDQTVRNKISAAYNKLIELGIEPNAKNISRYTDGKISLEVINNNLKVFTASSGQVRLDKTPEQGGYLLDIYESNTETPESQFLKKEKIETVTQALHSLPEDEKEVIYLSIYEEMTYDEIAERMGISASTVKNKKATGLRRLSTNTSLKRISGSNILSKDSHDITFLEEDELTIDDIRLLDDDIFEISDEYEDEYQIPMFEDDMDIDISM